MSLRVVRLGMVIVRAKFARRKRSAREAARMAASKGGSKGGRSPGVSPLSNVVTCAPHLENARPRGRTYTRSRSKAGDENFESNPDLIRNRNLTGPWAGKVASLYGFEQTAGQEAIYTYRSCAVRVGADHMHRHGRNYFRNGGGSSLPPAQGNPRIRSIQPQTQRYVQRLRPTFSQIGVVSPMGATMLPAGFFSRSAAQVPKQRSASAAL